jgi:hypothetical protein
MTIQESSFCTFITANKGILMSLKPGKRYKYIARKGLMMNYYSEEEATSNT